MDLPFIQVEEDVQLAMRLCAERTTLSGEEFSRLLIKMIETCRAQGFRAGTASISHAVPILADESSRTEAPHPELHLVKVETIPHIRPLVTIEEARAKHEERKAAGIAPHVPELPPLTKKRLTDEQRRSIRERYKNAKLEARAAGNAKIEHGWVKRIAREYDVSDATIYNVVYSDPQPGIG